MTEQTREEQIRTTLQELSINQLTQATENFLSHLEQQYPAAPTSVNGQNLIAMGRFYFEEYLPLLTEWGRRQTADNNYQPEKHFPIIQKLRGKLPDNLRQELNGLQKRQSNDPNWKPQTDGTRLRFLQKIANFYNRDRKLPFPWLNFCLQHGEEIKQLQQSLWKKQATENLTPEKTSFLNFLTESGVGEILD